MSCKDCKKYSDLHMKCNHKDSRRFNQPVNPETKNCGWFISMDETKEKIQDECPCPNPIVFPKVLDLDDDDLGDYWGLYPPSP